MVPPPREHTPVKPTPSATSTPDKAPQGRANPAGGTTASTNGVQTYRPQNALTSSHCNLVCLTPTTASRRYSTNFINEWALSVLDPDTGQYLEHRQLCRHPKLRPTGDASYNK